MINLCYMSSGSSASGYGSSARSTITALYIAGANVTCETIQQTPEKTDYGLEGKVMQELEGRDIPYRIKILHVTPDCFENFSEEGKYHIARLVWELEQLPESWIKPLKSVNEIWVATEKQRHIIEKNGIDTPTFVFPESIDITRAEENIQPFTIKYTNTFANPYIFYCVGQWIDRKNFRSLIRSYWKAFQAQEQVALLLKTYRVNYTNSQYELIKKDIQLWKQELNLPSYPQVLLCRNLLTDKQIWRLHKTGDCYVTASCAEGFHRGIQEAMIAGRPVISPDTGGILDFFPASQYFSVNSKLVQATEQSHIPYYTSNMKWYQVDENHLSEVMKYAFNNQAEGVERAKIAQQVCMNFFSYKTIGEMMYNRLIEISKLR